MNSKELKLLKDIIRGIPELVIVVSETGEYLEIGGVSEHDPDRVVGRSLLDMFPEEVASKFVRALGEAFADQKQDIKTIEYELEPSDELKISLTNDETRMFELKINPLSVTCASGRIAVCICRDITDLRRNEQMLVSLSERDQLTGIYNRNKSLDSLQYCFEQYKRYQVPTSFMIVDLDNFKGINDHYGHVAGDRAIRHFADTCQAELRATDIFARYGGDEFAIVMPNTTQTDASVFAQRIRGLVGQSALYFKQYRIPLSVSVGVSQFESTDCCIESVIHRADRSMYLQKNNSLRVLSV